jgi:hypothetical protein
MTEPSVAVSRSGLRTLNRNQTMRALAALLLVGFLWASASCRRDSASPEGGSAEVTAVREAGGLRLVNQTERPIAFTVFEREFAARVQFAPCVDPSPGCLRLAPGASILVPYAEIGGYTSGAREAIVHWWHVVPDGAGGYRAEAIRSEVVRL